MNNMALFTKKIHQIEASIERFTVLNTLYEASLDEVINKVCELIQEVNTAITEDEENGTNNNYNFIDNTIFDLQNLLDDLKMQLNEIVSADVYVLIMNEDLSFLKRINQKLIILKNNTSSLIKATILLEEQAPIIVSKYLSQIKKTIIEEKCDKAIVLYNELGLDHYLVADNTTLSNWQQIYKLTSKVIKQMNKIPEVILDSSASFATGIMLRMVR